MRLLLQRVKQASVTVDKTVVSQIEKGLLCFLGIHKDDSMDIHQWYIEKMLNLRIFEDENGKMNRSLRDVQGEILVVSQFTLYGNCLNGRRPDFFESMGGEKAKKHYDHFISRLQMQVPSLKTGVFGAMMDVALINDGPVTFLIEKK